MKSKKKSKSKVDELLNTASEVVRFEASRGLPKQGLSLLERIERYAESFVSNGKAREAINDIFHYVTHQSEVSLHPAGSHHVLAMLTSEEKMATRAAQGSKTAKKYFAGIETLRQMRLALANGSYSEAFRLYRKADRIWQPLVIDSPTWKVLFDAATEAFDKNPQDSNAYFVIIHYNSGLMLSNNVELLRMARHCANLNPGVADFHYLLGNMYGFNRDGVSALRAFERALELEWEPRWLYSKASALRHQQLTERRRVIDAYKEYIAANEKDDRLIPEACYCIAQEYWQIRDEKMAREYYHKGLQAESPEVRLPCFEPVYDCPPKDLLAKLFMLSDMRTANPPSFAFSNDLSSKHCGLCGKPDAKSRCSKCKKAYYCDRECQLKHWKLHKKNCST